MTVPPPRIPSPPTASNPIYNPVELNLEELADVVIWGAGWEVWVHHRVLADRPGGGGFPFAADPSVRAETSVPTGNDSAYPGPGWKWWRFGSEPGHHYCPGKDGIPSIDNPRFVGPGEADQQMQSFERVLGVSINGDHRAYPLNMLSRHEIVNDTVGGVTVAVIW